MLSKLKVRTGIVLVLAMFQLAVLVSNGAAWLAMGSSNDKLDRVNSVYSNQATPVYQAYTSLQRSRLNLAAAAVELQEGRLQESSQFLEHARAAGNSASQSIAAFMKIDTSITMADKDRSVERRDGPKCVHPV